MLPTGHCDKKTVFCRCPSAIGPNHPPSPLKIGRLPYSYTGVWRELDRATGAAGLGHMGTHTFRHSYRMWIDAIGTPVGVQQKLMRHSDIRTTMNIYGDAASEDLREAHNKIVGLALHTA